MALLILLNNTLLNCVAYEYANISLIAIEASTWLLAMDGDFIAWVIDKLR